MRSRTLCLIVLSALCFGAHAASLPPLVSIVDGDAVLLRDAGRHAVSEGLRLAAGDILETDPKARLLRVEFADELIADLGPGTKVLLTPRLLGEPATRMYLLRGWIKLTAGARPAAASEVILAAPRFALKAQAHDVIASVSPTERLVFPMSTEVSVFPRGDAEAAPPARLKAGDFWSRQGDAAATLAPRPPADFSQRVPRAFVDTLPRRAALFKEAPPKPKRLGDIAYDDVEPWIDAEPALRPMFVTAWKSQARRPAFRKPLEAGLAAHPEWDRVLFPEKYLPLPVSAAAQRQP
jgi:hypothetical protein